MAKITFKQKSTLIIFSIFATVLCVEIALRTAGFIHLTLQDRRNKVSFNRQDAYRILCTGESMTFNGGASAYPRQLENILNDTITDKEFEVINKGLPAKTSGDIIDNMGAWLETYKPHIVVAMMGINDYSILVPFSQRTKENRIMSFFKNLRVVKLAYWLKTSFEHRARKIALNKPPPPTKPPQPTPATGAQDSAESISSEDKELIPGSYFILYVNSQNYKNNKEYNKAEKVLRVLIEKNINSTWNNILYQNLGDLFLEQGKYREFGEVIKYLADGGKDYWVSNKLSKLCRNKNAAKEIIKTLREMFANNPYTDLYDLLGFCYEDAGDSEQAKHYLAKTETIRLNYYNSTTKKSYLKLLTMLNEKDIQPVLVQYPLRSVETLKRMLASEVTVKQMIFVDNEKTFRAALKESKREDYFTDRFAGDFGHCTPKGNRLIAQNIADAIIKNLFSE